MAAGYIVVGQKPGNQSPPTAGYFFNLIYQTDLEDPSTRAVFPPGQLNVTLPGLEQEFTVQGIEMQVLTNSFGDSAAAACYGTYDEASIVKYTDTLSGHDPTQMTVDLWLSGAEGSGVSRVLLFVY